MVMFRGMTEGWFRSGETLDRYFNTDTDDPYGAREIINGDKSKVPSWSGGVPIGNLIAGYHDDFLEALTASWVEGPVSAPELATLRMTLDSDVPIRLVITRGANVVEVLV
jgi:putative chitinase